MTQVPMERSAPEATARAAVYGDPGDRARLAGLMRAAWPVLVGVFLAGAALGLLAVGRVGAAGAILLTAAAVLLVAPERSARRVRAFHKGARGEGRVAAALAALPASFAVFHGVDVGAGVALSGAGDIDHIVVGPTGVWVIETKCWDGQVEVRPDGIRFDGKPPSRDPVAQVRRLTARVADGLAPRLPNPLPVRPLLCFAGSGFADGEAAIGEVAVCGVGRLLDRVADETRGRIADDDRTRLVEMLKQAL